MTSEWEQYKMKAKLGAEDNNNSVPVYLSKYYLNDGYV